MTTITEIKEITGTQKRRGLLKFLLLAIFCIQFSAFAKTISLSWDQSPDANIVGFNVYYGTESGTYTNVVTVGNGTDASISGLIEGVTYYFAVTAFNSFSQESEFSDEISYTVPLPAALQMQSSQQNGVPTLAISATGTVSTEWTLESSVDLKVWSYYTNGTGAINIQVPIVGEPNRFFRLKNQ